MPVTHRMVPGKADRFSLSIIIVVFIGFVVDDTGASAPVAIIGVAEKGWAHVKMTYERHLLCDHHP